jgi:hypothetical protein
MADRKLMPITRIFTRYWISWRGKASKYTDALDLGQMSQTRARAGLGRIDFWDHGRSGLTAGRKCYGAKCTRAEGNSDLGEERSPRSMCILDREASVAFAQEDT